MASYTELRSLFSDDELKNRVDIAIIVAANNLLSGTPTVPEQQWAAHAFTSPRAESEKALMVAIASNKDLSVAQIQAVADAGLQVAVDAAVSTLVVAFTG